MTDDEYWNRAQALRVRLRSRLRVLWTVRALALGLTAGCGGSVAGWGIQHHVTQMVVTGAITTILSFTVMLLNWRVDNTP